MSKEKIEAFWKDATAEDVARVMAGDIVEARFRDIETDPWCSPRDLTGVKAVGDGKLRWFTLTSSWRFCQVYDPPQWWLDKPDPGEGFRLLEKFPAEKLQPEDDWWGIESKDWLPSRRACRGEQQDEDVWYRRRIEPVEPVEMVAYQAEVGEVIEFPCGIKLAATAKGFEVEQ